MLSIQGHLHLRPTVVVHERVRLEVVVRAGAPHELERHLRLELAMAHICRGAAPGANLAGAPRATISELTQGGSL